MSNKSNEQNNIVPTPERMEEMLNDVTSYMCIAERSTSVIQELIALNFTDEELLWLNFSSVDIVNAHKDMDY